LTQRVDIGTEEDFRFYSDNGQDYLYS
jgi:hypothetical protein